MFTQSTRDDVSDAVDTGIDFFLVDADGGLIALFGVFDALEPKSFGQAFQNRWFCFRGYG